MIHARNERNFTDGTKKRQIPRRHDFKPFSRHARLRPVFAQTSALDRLELHLGNFAGGAFCFEVRVVALETEQRSRDVLREQFDVGVVALHGFVIFTALHRDAIFRTREFILQAEEVFDSL